MSPLKVFRAAVGVLVLAVYSKVNAQTIFPPVVEGEDGATVTIMCVAAVSNLQNALEVMNGSSVFVNYETTADADARLTRVDSSTNTTLTTYTLTPLRLSDNGAVFRCSPQPGADTTLLSVLFPPSITRLDQQGDPVQVTEGQISSVTFMVTGNPFPSFMWTENGQMVGNGSGLTAGAFSLMLNPADRQHEGSYRLIVTNSIGSADYNFTLDVLYGPVFPSAFVEPNLNSAIEGNIIVLAANPGQDFTLLCNATGNPTPDIVPTIPQGSANAVTANNNIVITGVAATDAGNYSCTAGNVVRRFQLFVGGVPQPVSMISININDDFIESSWTYDNSVNGVPATYFIFNISLNATTVMSNRIPANTTMITTRVDVSELMSLTTYTATVVVRNLQGDSPAVSNIFSTPSGSIMISASWSVLSFLILAYAMCI